MDKQILKLIINVNRYRHTDIKKKSTNEAKKLKIIMKLLTLSLQ